MKESNGTELGQIDTAMNKSVVTGMESCHGRISSNSSSESQEASKLVYNNKGQQMFPGIVEGRSNNVILSIHPEYSDKILSGEKTVELRRRFAKSIRSGTKLFIYSTSPINAIVGSAEIASVKVAPVKQIWEGFNQELRLLNQNLKRTFADWRTVL